MKFSKIPPPIEIPFIQSVPIIEEENLNSWQSVKSESDFSYDEEINNKGLQDHTLSHACYYNDLSLVRAHLQDKVAQGLKPQEYFVVDEDDTTNVLQLAVFKAFDEQVGLLLAHLYEKDRDYGRALFASPNDNDYSLLYLSLLNRNQFKTTLMLFEWAAKFGVDPKSLAQGVSFKKLLQVLVAEKMSDRALRMLIRTLACLHPPKDEPMKILPLNLGCFLRKLLEVNWSQEEYGRLKELEAFLCSKNRPHPFSLNEHQLKI